MKWFSRIFYRRAETPFVVLDADRFRESYHLSFSPLDLATESAQAAFLTELRLVQNSVHDALAARWSEQDDFGVMWDFNHCYHACGGIYTERIFSLEYVDSVNKVMLEVDHERKWTFHTSCEILVNPDGRMAGESIEDRGEFFIRAGACYINSDRLGRVWRKRLGCGI